MPQLRARKILTSHRDLCLPFWKGRFWGSRIYYNKGDSSYFTPIYKKITPYRFFFLSFLYNGWGYRCFYKLGKFEKDGKISHKSKRVVALRKKNCRRDIYKKKKKILANQLFLLPKKIVTPISRLLSPKNKNFSRMWSFKSVAAR